jgi:hypothetical protein
MPASIQLTDLLAEAGSVASGGAAVFGTAAFVITSVARDLGADVDPSMQPSAGPCSGPGLACSYSPINGRAYTDRAMLRRLATYPLALASATAYALIGRVFDTHGAADVALFAVCGLVGAAIAVPLALSAPPRRRGRHGVSSNRA